jgi:hypothetical protein
MEPDQIDNLLVNTYTEHREKHADRYIDHYLEQYRVYLHIFNSTSDHRHKSNEFFLGLNTAIMGIMGYLEIRNVPQAPVIFVLAPLVGIAICFCWYQLIVSWSHLNRAKFKVIHALERKLPAALFETEWKLLGKSKDNRTYRPFSQIEKFIPIIFIIFYIIIFAANSPIAKFFNFSW